MAQLLLPMADSMQSVDYQWIASRKSRRMVRHHLELRGLLD